MKALYPRGPDVGSSVTGRGDRGVRPRGASTGSLDVVDPASTTASHAVTITVHADPPTPTQLAPQPQATPVPAPTRQPQP